MKIKIDFRLLDVSLEIHALEDHLNLIKKQISHLIHVEQSALDEYRQKEKLKPEDPEWNMAQENYDHRVEFLLPRFFFGAFIVNMYAVFETAVTEIARLIQTAQGQEISMGDLKGDFLERANKYYKSILHFELYSDNKTWQTIKMLAELRNAITHVNGRLDMLNENSRSKIKNWGKQGVGITSYYNYLLIDENCARETFTQIRLMLDDLVERYKEWDTYKKSV